MDYLYKMKAKLLLACLTIFSGVSPAQHAEVSQPLSNILYGRTTSGDVKQVMDRLLQYIDPNTPFEIINRTTGEKITDLKRPVKEATIAKGEFNIFSHEWGLAYRGMLMAGEVTGDQRYKNYVSRRLEFLNKAVEYFNTYKKTFPGETHPLEHFLDPEVLDDTGSMCAAIIQSMENGLTNDLRPVIDRSINFIMADVHRLQDGTFARNRPMPNSVWVDDLYQGIPALALMGRLTGEQKYYDEAARQVRLFSEKLFDRTKGICLHGWVEGMEPHPAFYWARANGWAILAIAVVLDVLPDNHPERRFVLELFKAYCYGLAQLQSGTGFWHQLLDRDDSFLETSATAMFTYALAHGVNQGWLDVRVYGPVALLGWNAVSTKVNDQGQVEGTSAGTSMAFDAFFYYQRPIGTGPHGYGSVLLAASAMYKLLNDHSFEKNGPVIFRK